MRLKKESRIVKESIKKGAVAK